MRLPKYVSVGLLVLALVLTTILPSMAASTTKSLSTNFTLVNLGDGVANGIVSYVKPDGTPWKADDTFKIDNPGGQVAFKQYFDNNLSAGQGSGVVSADQPLGAVVQIQARPPQVPSMGAYIGMSAGAATEYVPLVLRRLVGASGIGNSQITVQNAGSNATGVTIRIVKPDGTTQFSKSVTTLAAGASYVYDLDDEADANIPPGFVGSAVVSAATGGQVAVVSNLFTGANGLMTFNAFSSPGQSWLVPQFSSRLGNGLSTPVAIQNLSGGPLAAGAITFNCTKNPNSTGSPNTISLSNPAQLGDSATFNINPVVDMSLPADWYGSCTIASTGNVVAFVQMRVIGTDRAAAYEAIKGGTTDKTVVVPLAAKRLSNQFATVTDLVNVSTSADAHVNFQYIPSPDYVAGGGSSATVAVNNVTVPMGQMIQHNLRVATGPSAVTQLPDGWYGSIVITSTDQPINAIVELTMLSGDGDTYQAHNAFTKP